MNKFLLYLYSATFVIIWFKNWSRLRDSLSWLLRRENVNKSVFRQSFNEWHQILKSMSLHSKLQISRDGRIRCEMWTWQNCASFSVGLAFLSLLKVLKKGHQWLYYYVHICTYFPRIRNIGYEINFEKFDQLCHLSFCHLLALCVFVGKVFLQLS